MSAMTITGSAGINTLKLTATGDANKVHISGQETSPTGFGDVDVTITGAAGHRHISGWVDQVNVNLNTTGNKLFGTIGDGAVVSISSDGPANNESFSGEIGQAFVSGGAKGNTVSSFMGNDHVDVTTSGAIPGLDPLDYLIALTPIRLG